MSPDDRREALIIKSSTLIWSISFTLQYRLALLRWFPNLRVPTGRRQYVQGHIIFFHTFFWQTVPSSYMTLLPCSFEIVRTGAIKGRA